MSDNELSIFGRSNEARSQDPSIESRTLLRCHNYACSYQTYEERNKCPMCGRNMLTASNFRMLGGVLLGIGIVLVAMGSSLFYFLHDKMPKNDERSSVAFVIFAAILGAGLLASSVGIYQMVAGTKSKKLTVLMLLSFSAILGLAALTRVIF